MANRWSALVTAWSPPAIHFFALGFLVPVGMCMKIRVSVVRSGPWARPRTRPRHRAPNHLFAALALYFVVLPRFYGFLPTLEKPAACHARYPGRSATACGLLSQLRLYDGPTHVM
jgi:hypothetical protein